MATSVASFYQQRLREAEQRLREARESSNIEAEREARQQIAQDKEAIRIESDPRPDAFPTKAKGEENTNMQTKGETYHVPGAEVTGYDASGLSFIAPRPTSQFVMPRSKGTDDEGRKALAGC